MGTASFSISEGNKSRGAGSPTMLSTRYVNGGAFTTSTSAATLQDSGASNVTLAAGQVIQIHADEAMRVQFGGVAVTASTGHYIPGGLQREFECDGGDAGTVSIIDVA